MAISGITGIALLVLPRLRMYKQRWVMPYIGSDITLWLGYHMI